MANSESVGSKYYSFYWIKKEFFKVVKYFEIIFLSQNLIWPLIFVVKLMVNAKRNFSIALYFLSLLPCIS
jgi:hypothetical protein